LPFELPSLGHLAQRQRRSRRKRLHHAEFNLCLTSAGGEIILHGSDGEQGFFVLLYGLCMDGVGMLPEVVDARKRSSTVTDKGLFSRVFSIRKCLVSFDVGLKQVEASTSERIAKSRANEMRRRGDSPDMASEMLSAGEALGTVPIPRAGEEGSRHAQRKDELCSAPDVRGNEARPVWFVVFLRSA
jgi:hypothetical protein